jgi:hypothetical protein
VDESFFVLKMLKSLVSQDSNVAGTVNYGSACIIQQTAEIVALLGRKHPPFPCSPFLSTFFFFFKEVMMGDANILESVVIKATKESRPVVIGSGNIFEDRCVIENSQIGDFCVVGVGATLVDCTLVGGNWIAPRVELKASERGESFNSNSLF